MEIEEQLVVANQSTARHVRVAQNEMASCVFRRVTARLRQHLGPMIELRIIGVHEFGLAVMNRLAADVDVNACQKIKPKLGFAVAHIGHGGALPPLIAAASARINHFLVPKVAPLDGPAQSFKRPRRRGQIVYVAGNDFENAGLQDQFRIDAVNLRGVCSGQFHPPSSRPHWYTARPANFTPQLVNMRRLSSKSP